MSDTVSQNSEVQFSNPFNSTNPSLNVHYLSICGRVVREFDPSVKPPVVNIANHC